MNNFQKLLLNSVYGFHLKRFKEKINIKEIFMKEKKVKKVKVNFEKEMQARIEDARNEVRYLEGKYDAVSSELKEVRSYLGAYENALEIYKASKKK